MERNENLDRIAVELEKLIRENGRRKDITITFRKLDDTILEEFTAWDRKYFNLVTGEECFLIWENSCPLTLLYVVNVAGDSLLTAASELLNLASRKF